MKTVNRGWLKRQVKAGKVEAKCTGHYTDDYAFDAANGFGKMDEWKPVRVLDDFTKNDFRTDVITLYESSFSSKSGAAYTDGAIIAFWVHNNLHYDMRITQ